MVPLPLDTHPPPPPPPPRAVAQQQPFASLPLSITGRRLCRGPVLYLAAGYDPARHPRAARGQRQEVRYTHTYAHTYTHSHARTHARTHAKCVCVYIYTYIYIYTGCLAGLFKCLAPASDTPPDKTYGPNKPRPHVFAQVGLNSTPPSPKPLGFAPGSSSCTSAGKFPTDKNKNNTGNGDKAPPSPYEEWRNPNPNITAAHTSDSGPEAAVQTSANAGTGRGGSNSETPGAAALRIASSTSIVAQDKAQDGFVHDLSRCKLTSILSMS